MGTPGWGPTEEHHSSCSGGVLGFSRKPEPQLGPNLQHRLSHDPPHQFWLHKPHAWGLLCGAPLCMRPQKAGFWELLWPYKTDLCSTLKRRAGDRDHHPETWAGGQPCPILRLLTVGAGAGPATP